MACSSCAGRRRATGYSSSGEAKAAARAPRVKGWEVTYPDGTVAPNLFLTPQEAEKETRRRGGTSRPVT